MRRGGGRGKTVIRDEEIQTTLHNMAKGYVVWHRELVSILS